MKTLTFCADDFAQSHAISAGILDLVAIDRLHAVSCLTESPIWHAHANELRTLAAGCQIGLHFNLTHPFGQKAHRLPPLLSKALLGKLDPAWIRKRFDSQWREFERGLGRPPDFVDGHQHVHAFPIIRDVVIQRLESYGHEGWIRTLGSLGKRAPTVKTSVLRIASRGFTRLVHDCGIPTNPEFEGLRSYRPTFDFGNAIREWLRDSPDGTLIMCHPGRPANDAGDPIGKSRHLELDYLASESFGQDLSLAGVRLGCLPR